MKPLLTRRHFLRAGLAGGALLLGVRLAWGPFARMRLADVPEQFKVLNERTATALAVIAPAMLGPVLPPEDVEDARLAALHALLKAIDQAIAALPVPVQAEVNQLLDLLVFPLTRRWLAGIRGEWTRASEAEITDFLYGWRTSRFQLLRAGYQGLHQLLCAGWYALPTSQQAIGYPGPPAHWLAARNPT